MLAFHNGVRAQAIVAAAVGSIVVGQADAHVIAGEREFPITLTIGDPGVADEASIPILTYQRQPDDPGTGRAYQYNISADFYKRVTENVSIGVSDGYSIRTSQFGKNQTGFQDLNVILKYRTWVDAPHEAIVSLGMIRELGRTGTSRVGADEYGSTTPTIYFGKGFGDVPVPLLRPFAITGTLGYTFADKKLKASGVAPPGFGASAASGVSGLAAEQFNRGYANRLTGGVSLQYSLPYLRSQVRDVGLPDFLNRFIPLVEVAYSSPASRPSNLGTQVVVAPGFIYVAKDYQIGVEALIPANRASGRFVGVIAQLHVFFEDLFPMTIGKPLFGGE